MRYHDTGSRSPAEALSTWLREVLTDEVTEFRVQTGYFSAKALGLVLPVIERAAKADLVTNVLVGSNDASTVKTHVEKLLDVMGIPRTNARLGVVSFKRGLFHPKVFHIRRNDDSQAAFVGSANLTREGLALNIEAAISLDTRDGDDEGEVTKIATAIDDWFVLPLREGITLVDSPDVIEQLVADGILAETPPPKTGGEGTGTGTAGPRLTALMPLPTILMSAVEIAGTADDDDFDPSVPPAAPPPVTILTPGPAATATNPASAPAITQGFANKNAFWIETGALTGGSRNQLDLSMVTKHSLIAGSISLFGVNSAATTTVTSVIIRYQGVDYTNCKIKFPVTASGNSNGTWRLQLNGVASTGQILTANCPSFVHKILVFTPLAQNHYEIALVSPRSALSVFKANSTVWDCNRGGGRHFGRI